MFPLLIPGRFPHWIANFDPRVACWLLHFVGHPFALQLNVKLIPRFGAQCDSRFDVGVDPQFPIWISDLISHLHSV